MIAFFRSMAGRVFLILVIGVVASALLAWGLAAGERQRVVAQLRDNRVLEQAEQFVLTLDALPAGARSSYLQVSGRFDIKGRIAGAAARPRDARTGEFAQQLDERLGPAIRVASLPLAEPACRRGPAHHAEHGGGPIHGICETLLVTLTDGSNVVFTIVPPHGLPPPHTDPIVYLALFLACIAVLAYVVSRMTVQPLQRLARAAEDLGGNIDRPPLLQQGATEIRQAASAFNAMQARLRNHIAQRTQMLAAITHDLQTPLTRLRLRLEKVGDDALRDKLIDDLAQTQAIVREGLDLARSIETGEAIQTLDLDSLLDSLCSDAADAGQPVTLEGKSGVPVAARPLALRRCFANLIDNAMKYGQAAHLQVDRELVNGAVHARIRLRDNGPGIPPDQLDQVFEPFYRIEASRSRQTGGTGLGLTIARNIIEQHGGRIALRNPPAGGLEVTVILPASPPAA